MKNYLFTAFRYENLSNYDKYEENSQFFHAAYVALDRYQQKWLGKYESIQNLRGKLEQLVNDFRSLHANHLWGLGDRGTDSSDLFVPHFRYINSLFKISDNAKARIESLRKFKKYYVAHTLSHQQIFRERIIEYSVNSFVDSWDNLFRSRRFSAYILGLTSPARSSKYSQGENTNMRYFKNHYDSLVKVSNLRPICSGELDIWRQTGCETALLDMDRADRTIQLLVDDLLPLQSRILIERAEQMGIDTQPFAQSLTNLQIENRSSLLEEHDLLLREVDSALGGANNE